MTTTTFFMAYSPRADTGGFEWCGRRDSNPHGVTPNGFSYQLRLSPPPEGVCGLDYPFTVAAAKAFRVRCCPSSLYTFPDRIACSGLGSGSPSDRFPRL